MPRKRKHWTQTAKGKSRLKEIGASSWKNRKSNGHAEDSTPKLTKARIAKEEVFSLARKGAQLELAELELRIQKLQIFLAEGKK